MKILTNNKRAFFDYPPPLPTLARVGIKGEVET
jgi:hypothetical protein